MIDFGQTGRMISPSKSSYRLSYPDNIIVFNANVLTKNGKIWHGDLDVTCDLADLQRLAATLNEEIWVLREMDARFDKTNDPVWDNFVVRIKPSGVVIYP